MSWTAPGDLRSQVQRLWDRGRLLAALVDAEPGFPLRLVLKTPSSTELSERFEEARAWSRALLDGAKTGDGKGYRLVQREVRHRVIGSNALPVEAWLDSIDDALFVIGKQRDGQRFARLLARTRAGAPSLVAWLSANPLRALAFGDDFPRLLDIVAWVRTHPRPNMYLRQVDLPGIHSKFIEEHVAVLSELLDRSLPADAVDASASGSVNFVQRYGFRGKPVRVRLRVLDPRQALLRIGRDEDITMDHETFARLDPATSRVLITENEINFLALPPLPDSIAIFGSGYGFDSLVQAAWLQDRTVHYWGDIDTHGFAILDQLRVQLAHVESLLMDRATLMAHRLQWIEEPQVVLRDLLHLDSEERALFDDLRWRRLGDQQVRLEQERISFGWIEQALRARFVEGCG